MTFRDDPRLEGREPEFARMSLRPGIGHGFITRGLVPALARYDLDRRCEDVPVSLRHGSKLLPLGRYLRRETRGYVSEDGEKTAPRNLEREKEVLALLEASIVHQTSLAQELVEVSRGKVASLEARDRIFKKRSAI